MRLIDLKLIAILSLLTFIPTLSRADVIVAKDTFTGIVIGKNKEPIPGAKVEIIGQPYSVFTDIDGRFIIKCDPGAKKVLVSYPKVRDVKKKITPDMTVRIGRNWRQAPDKYQWFVGANIGLALTATIFTENDYSNRDYEDDGFFAPNISIMAGRVKTVGWYVKGFLSTPAKGIDYGIEKATTGGAILGGMVRLGSPVHLYLGGGFGYTDLKEANKWWYDYNWSWQIDMGLLFRIKDNYGFNMSTNLGLNKSVDVIHASVLNFGFSYFFDK